VFCDLDASQQLSSEQVEALLQALMPQSSPYYSTKTFVFYKAIYRLPGAMQLSSSAVVRLLRTAIRLHGVDATAQLCDLQAAADISSADVASLLREASAQPTAFSMQDIIGKIIELPAIDQLNSAEVAQLLHAAAQHCADGARSPAYSLDWGLTSLCALGAAQELSSEQVLQPLQLVVRCSHVCTEALCKLPALQQLSSEAVAQLLQAAIAGGNQRAFELLCKLPAVQQLSSEAATQLLQGAIAGGSERSFPLLCELPAAVQLASEQLVQVLESAVNQGSAAGCAELCKLPAAMQLSSETLEGLLQAAQQHSTGTKHAKSATPLGVLLAIVRKGQQMTHL
jgi:hypothetical protein